MLASSLKNRSKQISRSVIISLKYRIDANPKLKEQIVRLFEPFPRLKERLKGIRPAHRHLYIGVNHIEGPEQLPPRARQCYNDLEKAIENQKRGA